MLITMVSGHCIVYSRYTVCIRSQNIRYLKTSTIHELGSEGSWTKKKKKKKEEKSRPSQQKKKERYGQSKKKKKTHKGKKKNPRAPPTHPPFPRSLSPSTLVFVLVTTRKSVHRSIVRCNKLFGTIVILLLHLRCRLCCRCNRRERE